MRKPFCFDILVASPSDVTEERNLTEKLCDEWNSAIGIEKNIRVEVKRWEKNLKIDSRQGSQQLVNQQLVANCDVLFAIFGKRFGTPTESHDSGTIEEIEEIIKIGKPFFVYFMKHQYLLDEIDTTQVQKIKRFKNELKKRGSYKEIADPDSFRKEFYSDITYHVDSLLKKVKDSSVESSNVHVINSHNILIDNRIEEKENWYELSISDLMNKYLVDNNQKFAVYKRGITFLENCGLWKSISEVNHPALVNLARSAREYAFNTKYGNYDYSKDLRTRYPQWYKPILDLVKGMEFTGDINVIGIASNYGQELDQVFNQTGFSNIKMDVLDLSTDAVNKGKHIYPNINFFKGEMEECTLKNSDYDIYLNLRSIHSSGVDYQLALVECYRLLKLGGLAIFSVSNGYLTPKKPGSDEYFEVNGLYDNRTESFSKHRPLELARKISSKLIDYGFKTPYTISGKTEIFIAAEK